MRGLNEDYKQQKQMSRLEAIHDIKVLIAYFEEESGATPICLEYCLNMLEGRRDAE